MAHVLRVAALQVRDPVPLFILMKADDAPLGHRLGRSSIYVDFSISVVNPNFA